MDEQMRRGELHGLTIGVARDGAAEWLVRAIPWLGASYGPLGVIVDPRIGPTAKIYFKDTENRSLTFGGEKIKKVPRASVGYGEGEPPI